MTHDMFGSLSYWKLYVWPQLNLLAMATRHFSKNHYHSSQKPLDHQPQNSSKASLIHLHILYIINPNTNRFNQNDNESFLLLLTGKFAFAYLMPYFVQPFLIIFMKGAYRSGGHIKSTLTQLYVNGYLCQRAIKMDKNSLYSSLTAETFVNIYVGLCQPS